MMAATEDQCIQAPDGMTMSTAGTPTAVTGAETQGEAELGDAETDLTAETGGRGQAGGAELGATEMTTAHAEDVAGQEVIQGVAETGEAGVEPETAEVDVEGVPMQMARPVSIAASDPPLAAGRKQIHDDFSSYCFYTERESPPFIIEDPVSSTIPMGLINLGPSIRDSRRLSMALNRAINREGASVPPGEMMRRRP
eukprot:2393666-Amphidinium_carterae.1